MGTKGPLLPGRSPELVWSVADHTAHGEGCLQLPNHSFTTGFAYVPDPGLIQRMLSLQVRDGAEGPIPSPSWSEYLTVVLILVLGTQLVTKCLLSCFFYLFSSGSCLILSGNLLGLGRRGPGLPKGGQGAGRLPLLV